MAVKNAKKKVSKEELEEVNAELRKAVGDVDGSSEEDSGGGESIGVMGRLVKALDRSVEYLGKAAVGKKVSRPVENASEYEMSDGTSTEEPTVSKKKEKRTEQSADESEDGEVAARGKYGQNAGHYPNRNRVNKADVEEGFELVEDSDGNVFAQDQEGNLYEVEEEAVKGGAGDRFLDRIDKDQDFVQVAEGSEALAHLTKCLAETLDEMEAGLHGHLIEMQEGQQVMLNTLQTHSKVFKAMIEGDEMRKSMPSRGAKGVRMAVVAGKDVKTTTGDAATTKADRREIIRKAVAKGDLEARFMNLYAAAEARGVNGLAVIPDTILKSLGLEDAITPEEMQKAIDEGVV